MTTPRPTLSDAHQFYSEVLKSLLSDVDDQGYISGITPDGERDPITVPGDDGQPLRLVFPTEVALRNANWEGKIAFHPLSESAYRGESLIIKKLKRLVVSRITVSTLLLMERLIELACTPSLHDTLTSKQTKLLEVIPNADDKTKANLERILTNLGRKPEDSLFSVYLKHGGKYKGEDCSRLGVVTFPVVEQFEDNKDRTVCGVKLRIPDFTALKALMEFIFPDADKPEAYNHGVLARNNESAPYFRALMGVYRNVASRLNSVSWLFRKHLDEYDLIHIPLEWEQGMDKLDAYRELIPPLTGNDGASGHIDQQTQPQPQNTSGLASPTAASPAPAAKASTDNSWNALKQKIITQRNPQAAAGFAPQAAPIQQPMMPQQGGYIPSWQRGAGQPQQQPQYSNVPAGHYANDPRLAPPQPQVMPWGQQQPYYQQQPMGYPSQQMQYGAPQMGGYQQPQMNMGYPPPQMGGYQQPPQPVPNSNHNVPGWSGVQSR